MWPAGLESDTCSLGRNKVQRLAEQRRGEQVIDRQGLSQVSLMPAQVLL